MPWLHSLYCARRLHKLSALWTILFAVAVQDHVVAKHVVASKFSLDAWSDIVVDRLVDKWIDHALKACSFQRENQNELTRARTCKANGNRISCTGPLVAGLRSALSAPPVSHFAFGTGPSPSRSRHCLHIPRAHGEHSRNSLSVGHGALAQQLVEILDELAIELAILESTTQTQAIIAKIEACAVTSFVAMVITSAAAVEATAKCAAIASSVAARKTNTVLVWPLVLHRIATRLEGEAAGIASTVAQRMTGAKAESTAATAATSMLHAESARIHSALAKIEAFAPEGSISTKEILAFVQVLTALKTVVALPSSYSPAKWASSAVFVAQERCEEAVTNIRSTLATAVAATGGNRTNTAMPTSLAY